MNRPNRDDDRDCTEYAHGQNYRRPLYQPNYPLVFFQGHESKTALVEEREIYG